MPSVVEEAFTSDENSDLRAYLKKLRFMHLDGTTAENSAFIIKPENKIFQKAFLKTLDLVSLGISCIDSSSPQFPLNDPQRFFNLITTSLSWKILKQFDCFLDIDENNPNVAIIPLSVANLKRIICYKGLGEVVVLDKEEALKQIFNCLKPQLREVAFKYNTIFKDAIYLVAFPIMSERLATRKSQFCNNQQDPVQLFIDTNND